MSAGMSGNVEALKRHYEATSREDWDGALAVMHPDIEFDGGQLTLGVSVARGHEAVRAATRTWLGAFRDQRYEPLRFTEIGPHVVAEVRLSGRARENDMPVEMTYAAVWTMENGLAVRLKNFTSEAEALEHARTAPRLLVRPTVMGVLNVTPDSFSDGGLFFEHDAAVEQGERLAAEGAAILDVGGESTRPGAAPVPEDEELRRVVPVVERLARSSQARLSIDTTKLEVARAAIEAGATVVNDVSAFRFAPGMAGLVAEAGADCCLMHMLGEPRTMQEDPRYDDVVSEVKAFLEERLAFAVSEGVPEQRVWLDPGIGFGKTVGHNLDLLRRLDEIVAVGRPVVVGTSRKSFLGKLTGRSEDQRLPATIAANVLALERGATVFRVHDVAPVLDALRMAAATVNSEDSTA